MVARILNKTLILLLSHFLALPSFSCEADSFTDLLRRDVQPHSRRQINSNYLVAGSLGALAVLAGYGLTNSALSEQETEATESYPEAPATPFYIKDIDLSQLSPSQGFSIADFEADTDDWFGFYVAEIGDINEDGIKDIAVSSPQSNFNSKVMNGALCVIYGVREKPIRLDIASLTADQGFCIYVANLRFNSRWPFSNVGDFNNDGVSNDLLLGIPSFQGNIACIIYARKEIHNNRLNITSLTPDQGFCINGFHEWDNFGHSVSSIKDFNDDKVPDVLIGSSAATFNGKKDAGAACIIYGGKHFRPFDIASLTADQGFCIYGANEGDNFGSSVSNAGDVDGDGVEDIIAGALSAAFNGKKDAGAACIIYGGKHSRPLDMASLTAAQGFCIYGANEGDNFGSSVSNMQDINNDGRPEILIGAPGATFNGKKNAGAACIIYGSKHSRSLDMASLTADQGFCIYGANKGDYFGTSVSNAGDVNGDGIEDIIAGAPGAAFNGKEDAGAACVIYGSERTRPLNMTSLTADQGFCIYGANEVSMLGLSVSNVGDVNGDSIDDIIAGALSFSRVNEVSFVGAAYIVYGANRPPILKSNVLPLSPFQSITLTPRILSVEEGDNHQDEMIFHIHNLKSGRFDKGPELNVNSFTQKDIKDGLITFTMTGCDPFPSYEVRSSNIVYMAPSVPANIQLTHNPCVCPTTSNGSRLQTLWHHLTDWFFPKPVKDTFPLSPAAQKLVNLQVKCTQLMNKAEPGLDKWYRYSLEDLHGDLEEVIHRHKQVNEETVRHFKRRLNHIQKDFIENTRKSDIPLFANYLKSNNLTGPNNYALAIHSLCTPAIASYHQPYALS